MKTPLAWHNLLSNKVRTAIALSGVAFAVVLIFMQLGFLGAVRTTATLIYNALDFDIAIRSKEYLHLSDPRFFPQSRLTQAKSQPGVARVTPFLIDLSQWRNPQSGNTRGILVMGVGPGAPVFKDAALREKTESLMTPEFLLVDRKSRREFGPANGRQFGDADLGVTTEIAGRKVSIGGHFALGAGLAADGAVLLSDRGFVRVVPGRTPDDVSLGLVKLQPGARPDAVAAELRSRLPSDVEVLTRDEVVDFELHRWVSETSIGVIFQLGVGVAVLVGISIVYQVLSSDVANHLAEYATLKAMGYGDAFLAGVVMQQAAVLAMFAFLPGLALSLVLYQATSYFANIPIEMTLARALGVFALSVVMCLVSGLGALRKIRSVDPADLF
jgi:putative ABC transport system permease protein